MGKRGKGEREIANAEFSDVGQNLGAPRIKVSNSIGTSLRWG